MSQTDNESLQESFLEAMRRLAATVCVLTCRDSDGKRYGMAASAVTSLSLSPVSIVACVNRTADFYQRMSRSGTFCVNILSDTQSEQSRVFGSPEGRDQRFQIGNWSEDDTGVPVLADAQANLICTIDKTVDYGSHAVVIGQVKKVFIGDKVAPLIYLNREYVIASQSPSDEVPA